jgi:taurine transport system substrate-binding protein
MKAKLLHSVVFTLILYISPSFFLMGSGSVEKSVMPEEIIIGYQIIPNGEIIAKDLGWHEKEMGVPIKWVQINSASELNTAIAGGSVHFGLIGSSGIATGISTGIAYEVIWIYDVIGDNEALVAKKDRGVKSVRDLVGKKVAVPFASTTHYHLLTALRLDGIDPESLDILDMQPPDILAAWQRGDIDATFVWEPSLAKLIELEGEVIITSRELAAKGFLTGDIGVVHSDFAEKYPDFVVKYLKTQVRAIEYYRNSPAKAAASVAEQFKISEKEAARQMNSLVMLSGKEQLASYYLGTASQKGQLAEVFKETADFLATQRTIRSAASLEAFKEAINPSYLEKALKLSR